jgi:hypothetical protein
MGRIVAVVGLGITAVTALIGALFVLQNAGRTTQLSLDLYVAAWQLSQPVSVPALVGVGFGVGAVAGIVLTIPLRGRLRRRIRSLEQQIALGGDGNTWK